MIIFFVFIVLFLLQTCKYFYNLNNQRLENSINFLKMEILEIENSQELEKLFYGNLIKEDLKKEYKFLNELEIYIEYKSNYYPNFENFSLKKNQIREKKYLWNFKKKEIIYLGEFLYKNNFMKIILVKNIKDELI